MKEAVLVIGNANNLAAGDDELDQILEDDLQFFVTLAQDDEDFRDVVDTATTGLIIVSSSANANQMDNNYFRSTLPALVLNDDAYPLFEVTDDGANDARTQSVRELLIVDETHPMAKGINGRGRIDITLDRNNVNVTVGRVDRGAQIVVSANNRAEAALFVYESGSELARVGNSRNQSLAKNRIVGGFFRENIIEDLDNDAALLLQNAIYYAWSQQVP
jgi:hypothetical protein